MGVQFLFRFLQVSQKWDIQSEELSGRILECLNYLTRKCKGRNIFEVIRQLWTLSDQWVISMLTPVLTTTCVCCVGYQVITFILETNYLGNLQVNNIITVGLHTTDDATGSWRENTSSANPKISEKGYFQHFISVSHVRIFSGSK